MANIHVGVRSGGTYQLVFHVAVPGGTNGAGVAWNTALLNSKLGGTSVLAAGDGTAGTIAAAELSSIQAGNTLEVVYSFSPTAAFEGESAAAEKTDIDAIYTNITTAALSDLQTRLQHFGLTLT